MRRRTAVLAFFLAAAIPAFAKPNFTGDWKLNTSKSDFGQMPAPSSMTAKVSHEEPNLKVSYKMSSDQGDMEFASACTTDAKECTNEMFGQAVKSVMQWDGDTLVSEAKAKFGDNDFTMTEKWTLSADGKTLTLARTFKSAMGEGEQKLVFEKQ
jgi:hypothetical protein